MEDRYKKSMVVKSPTPTYNTITQVQSIFPARLKYTGVATGKLYVWEKAGDIVSVENADLMDLMSKKVGEKGCCGDNLNGNPVFQIVK